MRNFCARAGSKAYGMSNWRLDWFAEAYEYRERMGYQGPSVRLTKEEIDYLTLKRDTL